MGCRRFRRRSNVASHWLTDVLEPDVSARRRGCDPAAERAELLRRSDGRRRRAADGCRWSAAVQHGTFSLRDIDSPRVSCRPATGDPRPDEEQIKAAFADDAARRARRGCTRAWPAPWLRCEASTRRCAMRQAPRRRPASSRCRRSSTRWTGCCGAQLALRPARTARRAATPRRRGGAGARSGRSASSSRGRMRSGRWTRWRISSGARSRRVRFRCSWSVRSVWCPRIFSKCWPTSPRTAVAQARAAGGLKEGE